MIAAGVAGSVRDNDGTAGDGRVTVREDRLTARVGSQDRQG